MTEKKTGAPKGNKNAQKHSEGLKAVNLRLPISELELFKADAKSLDIYFSQWILEACRAKLKPKANQIEKGDFLSLSPPDGKEAEWALMRLAEKTGTPIDSASWESLAEKILKNIT